jgi:Dual-action HEIGH metallo-peptidase
MSNCNTISRGKSEVRTFCLGLFCLLPFFPVPATAGSEYGTVSQPLNTERGVDFWTSQNNTVPVCWETAGYDREKRIAQRAVLETWSFWANINFSGWDMCPTTGEALHVRIRISPQGEDNAGASGSAALGTAALSKVGDNDPGVNFSLWADKANEGRVEYLAVHEFGHVLGFGHEQDSPDNEGSAKCNSGVDPDANAINITAYDRDSVMNYCNRDGNMTGHLTFVDIQGVQKTYGVRRPNVATRGVLLVGNFRRQQELNQMSSEDQRNTLITELAGRTRDTVGYYQSLNDHDLCGAGALLVYLRETGSRTDQQIKTMSADDMRNTVIVEVGVQTGRGRDLQAISNLEIIQQVVRKKYYIRGLLLSGKFRKQFELNRMSTEDQRNTLITELAGRTKDTVGYYQSLNDHDLSGAGGLLVYLRKTGSRTDQQIKTMSADDMRNTVIVEVGVQTGRGRDLQAISNFELIELVILGR